MEYDDVTVGRILSRREALHLFAAVGAGVLSGCTGGATNTPSSGEESVVGAADESGRTVLPDCIVRPEMTQGPYFVDVRLNRSDIRSDPSSGTISAGTPVSLTINVSDVGNGTCVPLQGAVVDVWQCDARGSYSGFEDTRAGFDTRGQQFLRGYQATDAEGNARFTTIYPGWYGGRAVHIHFKIRSESAPDAAYEFTSQLFFDEALTDQVHALPPYAERGARNVRNEADFLFRQGGEQLLLRLVPQGDGFAGTFRIGLDLVNA